jgi:exonuclease SbcD
VIAGQEVIGGAAFADDVAYVALGHLHRAQQVGAAHVRYAGSPIPLAMAEAEYHHQVVVVELAGAALSGFRTLSIPRTVPLVRVPRRGAAALPQVLAELAELAPLDEAVDPELRPFLEVRVRLDAPAPRLRADIEAALARKHPRLVKISVEAGGARAAGAARPAEVLAQLEPGEVVARLWQREHGGALPPAVAAAFAALHRAVIEETS